MSHKFHNKERLKSRKEIGRLFGKDGQSVNSYPIRLAFVESEEIRGTFPFQAAFVVPKRRFKKAVDPESNKIKAIPFYDMGDVVRERIIIQDAFMIQNMFSLIDNKWYLTEYSGMRDLAYFSTKKTVEEPLPEVVFDTMAVDSGE